MTSPGRSVFAGIAVIAWPVNEKAVAALVLVIAPEATLLEKTSVCGSNRVGPIFALLVIVVPLISSSDGSADVPSPICVAVASVIAVPHCIQEAMCRALAGTFFVSDLDADVAPTTFSRMMLSLKGPGEFRGVTSPSVGGAMLRFGMGCC